MSVSLKLREMLERFCARYRNYRPYDVGNGVVEKVWNNRRGSLALFRVYPKERIVVVNSAVFHRADVPKLANLICELELVYPLSFHRWKTLNTRLGYPEYYQTSLSLEQARKYQEERK